MHPFVPLLVVNGVLLCGAAIACIVVPTSVWAARDDENDQVDALARQLSLFLGTWLMASSLLCIGTVFSDNPQTHMLVTVVVTFGWLSTAVVDIIHIRPPRSSLPVGATIYGLICFAVFFINAFSVGIISILTARKTRYHMPLSDSSIPARSSILMSEPTPGPTASGDMNVPLLTSHGHTGRRSSRTPPPAPKQYGWGRLLRLAKPQRRWILAGCVALVIRLPFSLAVPHFVSETIGALIDGDTQQAYWSIACLCISGTVDALLDFWNFFLFGFAQQRLLRELRVRLFSAILRQEIGFFDMTSSGELTSRLAVDTAEMGSDLTWVFRFTIEAIVRISGILIYMFLRDWRLAFVAISVVPVCAIINRVYGTFLQKNARLVQTALAQANALSTEVISCYRTVFSFANEPEEVIRYSDAVQKFYRLNVRQQLMQGLYYMTVATFLINTCVQASLLTMGVHLYKGHKLEPKTLLAFMLYQGQLQEYCSNLLNSFTNLVKSTGAGAKVFELLDRKPGIHKGTFNPQHVATNISLQNVRFKYPTRAVEVLKDISFDVKEGEVVALVGSSGSGKSTVFHLIENFYNTDAGRVLLDGVDVGTYDHRVLHQIVGSVGQEPVLFSGTIEYNIMYSLMGNDPVPDQVLAERRQRMVEVAKIANAHDFISRLPMGYQTPVGERGVQLSGGQKQRIAIARALMANPRLLLLDEATSALDTESEKVVQEALERAMSGRTTLVIAHRLSTIRNANRILVMDQGRLVESGTHEELMRSENSIYRAFVQRQSADKSAQ